MTTEDNFDNLVYCKTLKMEVNVSILKILHHVMTKANKPLKYLQLKHENGILLNLT